MIRPKDKMRGCDTPAHTSKASLETCAHTSTALYLVQLHTSDRHTRTQARQQFFSGICYHIRDSKPLQLYASRIVWRHARQYKPRSPQPAKGKGQKK